MCGVKERKKQPSLTPSKGHNLEKNEQETFKSIQDQPEKNRIFARVAAKKSAPSSQSMWSDQFFLKSVQKLEVKNPPPTE